MLEEIRKIHDTKIEMCVDLFYESKKLEYENVIIRNALGSH